MAFLLPSVYKYLRGVWADSAPSWSAPKASTDHKPPASAKGGPDRTPSPAPHRSQSRSGISIGSPLSKVIAAFVRRQPVKRRPVHRDKPLQTVQRSGVFKNLGQTRQGHRSREASRTSTGILFGIGRMRRAIRAQKKPWISACCGLNQASAGGVPRFRIGRQ